MTFSNTPLPPSPHTSEDAHRTVAHRRRVRNALVAAAVVLVVGIPVTVFALLERRPSETVEPGPSSSSSVNVTSTPSVSASPTASVSTSPTVSSTDLTIAPGSAWMNGSAGTFPGTIWMAIRNNGPAPVDQVDLTFTLPPGVTTDGSAWDGCTSDTVLGTVSCSVPAPAVGATRSYSYGVMEDTLQRQAGTSLTVSATPHGNTDPNPADNAGTVSITTNGGASISLSAGRLAATDGHGTVTLTLGSALDYGPTAAFRLTFHYSTGVQPDLDGFPGCDHNATDQTITCLVLSPDPGTSVDYSFPFIVDTAEPSPQLSVAYAPDVWPSGQYVETVPIDVCRNC